MLKKTGFITKSMIMAMLVVALICAVNPVGVYAASADALITVTDNASRVYGDNQQTNLLIGQALDLRVAAKSGVSYYVLQAGYVDVYYNGASGSPIGSYFKPPYANGSWVTTISGNIETAPKTALSSQNNWTVQIPALSVGQVYELRIVAVRSGYDDTVYGHRFAAVTDFAFSSNIADNTIILSASAAVQTEGKFIVAAYKNGYLVFADMLDFNANLSDYKTFQADFNKYPIGEYEYKAFCWGADYVPLFPAIDVK